MRFCPGIFCFRHNAAAIVLFVVGIFIAANSHAQSFLTNGLVAYYPFNGDANDASSNGNNGTVNGAVFQTYGAGSKQALSFNGTASTYVQVPESTSLKSSNAITISLWCKGLPGQADGTILRKADNCSPGYFIRVVGAVSNVPSFMIDPYYGCPGGQGYTNFLACTGTSWQNLIATYSSSDGLMKTYENGVLVAIALYTNAIGDSGDLFIGGSTVHPNDGGFAGLINEVRIYNRALSDAEVQQLYSLEASNIIIVAAPYTIQTFQGQSAQLPIAKLINAATAPPGTTLTVGLPSSTSTLGGTLQLSNSFIIYTPPTGGTTNFTDTFAYTLTADSGASATGTVTVIVDIPTGNGQSVVGFTVFGGQATVSFAGIPDYVYFIEASTNLVDWTVISTNKGGWNGLFQFTDVNASQYPARFYRATASP